MSNAASPKSRTKSQSRTSADAIDDLAAFTVADEWVGELYNRPGHLIRRAYQIAMALYIEEVQGLDVTQLQYVILRAIHHYPRHSNRKLSELTAVDRTTVGWVVTSLESKGLIARSADPGDRRVKYFLLTPAGLRNLKQINSHMPVLQSRILQPLTDAERESFMHCLRKIVLTNNRYSRAPLNPGPSAMPVTVTAIPTPGKSSKRSG